MDTKTGAAHIRGPEEWMPMNYIIQKGSSHFTGFHMEICASVKKKYRKGTKKITGQHVESSGGIIQESYS